MARRMSVAMTQQHVIDRTKTVTRRKGWWLDKHGRHLVKPGDHLILVDRVMGFKKGERATVLAEVEVVWRTRSPLTTLVDYPAFLQRNPHSDYGWDSWEAWRAREMEREGFPGMDPAEFIDRFFVKAQGMSPDDDVTRIEWRYLDTEADETVARLGAQVHRLLADVVHLSGECQFNDYFCVTHMAYLGPSDLYCTRVTGIADALLLFIRTEVADALNKAAADVTNINSDDSAHELFRSLFAIRDWLRARAEEV